jgi:hypothetical protein
MLASLGLCGRLGFANAQANLDSSLTMWTRRTRLVSTLWNNRQLDSTSSAMSASGDRQEDRGKVLTIIGYEEGSRRTPPDQRKVKHKSHSAAQDTMGNLCNRGRDAFTMKPMYNSTRNVD